MGKYERFLKSKVDSYNEAYEFTSLEKYVRDIYENEGSTGNSDLNHIFSHYHSHVNRLLMYLNLRISSKHYTADESREMIYWKKEISDCQKHLSNSHYSFSIIPSYERILLSGLNFLESSGGSPIPGEIKNIEIQKYEAIFMKSSVVQIDRGENIVSNAKLIGSGSYANVYKYKDEFYDKHFAIKRAKNNLNKKEIERFKREFQFMKSQKSPYILEVYKYFDDESYTMELADQTLDEYISKNNNKITMVERIKLGTQILKAFEYIEDQKVFHRDISVTNILIKNYRNIKVIKISDFGLVKNLDSKLTSVNTEFKGSFNDPRLEIEGFDNYHIVHETFALTRLLYFVLTGRTRVDKCNDKNIKFFLSNGLSEDHNKRFQSITHLQESFKVLVKNILARD